jgi:hypothetical protein
MRELDDDLYAQDKRIAELDESIRGKDGELQDLEDLAMQRDRMLEQMQAELVDLEESKRREIEERRRKMEEELLARMNQPRKKYLPVKGDAIDEMMAQHINSCNYYVPVERLQEGHYMWGPKKIFAKIMNGKLIIRVGGGFMLIDEFLKHYENELRGSSQLIINVEEGDNTNAHHGVPADIARSGTPTKSKIHLQSEL